MRYLCVMLFVLLCTGCGQYDWSSDDLFSNQGSAPVVAFGSDLLLDDGDNLDQPYALPLNISDPDTQIRNLQLTWSGAPGDPAPVNIVQQGSQYLALFPRNGTYQLTLQVSDGRDTTQDSIIISVNASQNFAIEGNVLDNLSATQDLDVQLRFIDGTVIAHDATDSSGNFQFNNLIGSVSNFEVVVP